MTPAMREWERRLGAGYSIRGRLRVGRRGYVEWGPALFNPAGAFVQNVRRDVFRRLVAAGLVTEVRRDTTGVDTSGGGDQRGELGVAAGDGAGDGGGAAAAGGGGGGAG